MPARGCDMVGDGCARSAVGTRAKRCYINGLSEMGKWAAAAGDAPGGAEDEAEDERAQGARVGERHRMRERILHGDVDHSHASDHVPGVVRVDPRQMTILLDRCWSDAIWKSRSRPRFPVPHGAIGAARVAAGVGKALKTFRHGEGARSGRLDRQGATRPVAILAARGGRVPRSPTLGFSSMGRLPRSAALASHPGRDSPHSGHPRRSRTHSLTVRVTTPTFHTHRSSSASRWRSPSWSPCAGTSRSYSWRRATCSR